MRYKLIKETQQTRRSYGKYVARAVHHNTITAEQLEKEIQQHCSAKVSDCEMVICELADTVISHLQEGDVVVTARTYGATLARARTPTPRQGKAGDRV